jgi:hypothetical protein
MKRIILVFILSFLGVVMINAQSPDMFSYQAVARDDQGNVLSNQDVGIKISILQGSASGTVVYEEEHSKTTNAQGLVNLMIGNGSVLSGTFANIDWSSGPYFVKVELDETGGTNYSVMGTSQLLSVPYAKYAESSGNSFSGDYRDLSNKAWTQNNDSISTAKKVGINTSNPEQELHVDGGVKVEGTTADPSPNTLYSNMMPLAYADIEDNGVILEAYGISSVNHSSTGTYEVDLKNGFHVLPGVSVTPVNSSNKQVTARFYTKESNPKIVEIYLYDGNGNPIDNAFNLVVLGRAQTSKTKSNKTHSNSDNPRIR